VHGAVSGEGGVLVIQVGDPRIPVPDPGKDFPDDAFFVLAHVGHP